MNKVNFNEYAEDYERILGDQLKFFDEETDYFAEYKVSIMKNQVRAQPLKILEYGCGTGRNITFLCKMFPTSKIFGCDVSEKSLALAAKKNAAATFFLLDGNEAFFQKFDLILVACVFHHIPPELRERTMFSIRNLLSPEGELFIFEHNPYNPVTRNLVNTCPFDRDAILLKPKEMRALLVSAGYKVLRMRYALFFPSVLKKFRFLEESLGGIPLGGQYYFRALKPYEFS